MLRIEPGPLEEQPVLLTAEPPLQRRDLFLIVLYVHIHVAVVVETRRGS